MKKNIAFCMTLLLMVILCRSVMSPVKASVYDYNWIGALLQDGYDDFYGRYVTAYEEGKTASLVVDVYNDYYWSADVNVSAVKVGFDWGSNYTSADCSMDTPVGVTPDESHIFTVTFTVPSTSTASNLVTHSYTIYVEHVNSTSGPKRIVGTWTQSGSRFAVFSSDQAAAHNYKMQFEAYPSYYSIPFLTAKARELLTESSVEESTAGSYYRTGDFSNARLHYQNALEFVQQAWSNETEKWSEFEDAFAGILKGGENLLMLQGYAWLLFGVGFMLISIGALVYLIRKRPSLKAS